jgi:hypothetical protein
MASAKFRRNSGKQRGKILDTINLVLELLIIACAIVIAITMKKYMFLFPLMFFLSAVLNFCLSIKKYKMDEYASCIVLCLVALFLVGLSIFSLIVVL